jgi:cell division protein FtsZ
LAESVFAPAPVRIKVVGVGGGGCNALNRMVRAGIRNAEFIAVNTDAQALMQSEAPTRIQIGERESKGLGVGGDPSRGRSCAEESVYLLKETIGTAEIVFIAAGMGGGTGTGAAPTIARLAKESGALTIAIVTKPFSFEMARRQQIAEKGIEELTEEADTMIVIPNDRLLSASGDDVPVDDAFKRADDILMLGVRAISEVITVPGLINLDFNDVKAIMAESGPCWLSTGYGSGKDRVVEAARSAISSQLIEVPIEGARGVVYVVSGNTDLALAEVAEAANVIQAAVDKEALVIFGVTFDPSLGSDVRITLLATGFTSYQQLVAQRTAEEFREVIRGLDVDEDRLEAPAFQRRPISVRRLGKKKERHEEATAVAQPARREEVNVGLYEAVVAKLEHDHQEVEAAAEVSPSRTIRTTLDAQPTEVVLADSNHRVAYFNKETSSKPSLRTIVGRTLQECCPQESAATVDEILADLKSGERNLAQLYVDIEGRAFEIRFYALRDANGGYLGCIEVSQQVRHAPHQADTDGSQEMRPNTLVRSA